MVYQRIVPHAHQSLSYALQEGQECVPWRKLVPDQQQKEPYYSQLGSQEDPRCLYLLTNKAKRT